MTAAGASSPVAAPAHERLDGHASQLHAAPSIDNLQTLATKRQRVKSLQQLAPLGSDHGEEQPIAQPEPASGEALHGDSFQKEAACEADAGVNEELDPGFAEPLLSAVFGESMAAYYQRLRTVVAAATTAVSASGDAPAAGAGSLGTCVDAGGGSRWRVVASVAADGVYVHKRPIRGPGGGASPLAVCGSVLHHAVVYVKQGPLLHSLDYGPAGGADVTANVFEEAPPKRILETFSPGVPALLAEGQQQEQEQQQQQVQAAVFAEAGAELPYLYLGPVARGVEHPLVQQLISFAESRPYHALRNNCIHFADAAVRLLTAGAVRGAPLLYDSACGSVPPYDNPMLVMMQMMLRLSWFSVVDGSPLVAAFVEHRATAARAQQQPLAAAAVAAPAEADMEVEAATAATPVVDATVMECADATEATGEVIVEVAAVEVAAVEAALEDLDNNVAAAVAVAAEAAVAAAEVAAVAAAAAAPTAAGVEVEQVQEQENDHAAAGEAPVQEVGTRAGCGGGGSGGGGGASGGGDGGSGGGGGVDADMADAAAPRVEVVKALAAAVETAAETAGGCTAGAAAGVSEEDAVEEGGSGAPSAGEREGPCSGKQEGEEGEEAEGAGEGDGDGAEAGGPGEQRRRRQGSGRSAVPVRVRAWSSRGRREAAAAAAAVEQR